MGQLRLHSKHSLNYYLLNLVPDLSGPLPVRLALRARHQLTLEHIFEAQLMRLLIKLFAIFVETVIGEMHVVVVKALAGITRVLFSGKPHYAVLVQVDCHWADHGSYQNVDAEIVFMAAMQCRLLQILLHDVGTLGPANLPRQQLLFLFLSCWV